MDRVVRTVTLPTILRVLGIVALVFAIGAYVNFQARNLIAGPSITLENAPAMVQHERVVTLEGRAENIVKLTMNGREIHTDEHGVFREALILENGYTIAALSAEDRFGRTTTLTRGYVYTQLR